MIPNSPEGYLLIDKAKRRTSFSLVGLLRKKLNVKKIGHAGTLDPFATGVMILLVGKNYTKLSDRFLCQDKQYLAEVYLGKTTDTYDCEGTVLSESILIPTEEEILNVLNLFQGHIEQTPPMFSAKKINGQKLYDLARQGVTVERKAVTVHVSVEFISYHYPLLRLKIDCSKGTYIRSLAYDIGLALGCGAHLTNLRRTKSGHFLIEECLSEENLHEPNLSEKLKKVVE